MKFLRSVNRLLTSLEGALVVVLLLIMVSLAFLQVILRNVFSTGLLWADPFLRHMVLWLGFLGASLATSQEKHINLDIVQRFVSPRVGNLIRVTTNLFAAIVTGFLAQAGWTFLQSEIETAEILLTVGSTEFKAWWFQAIIPVGFGLMSFRFLLKWMEHVLQIFSPAPGSESPLNVPVIKR